MKKMEEYLSASLSLFLSLCFSFCYLRASFFLSFFIYIQGREESAFELSARSLANGFVKAKRRTRLHLSTSPSLSFYYETTVVVVVVVVLVVVVVELLLERCSLFLLPLVVSLPLVA